MHVEIQTADEVVILALTIGRLHFFVAIVDLQLVIDLLLEIVLYYDLFDKLRV